MSNLNNNFVLAFAGKFISKAGEEQESVLVASLTPYGNIATGFAPNWVDVPAREVREGMTFREAFQSLRSEAQAMLESMIEEEQLMLVAGVDISPAVAQAAKAEPKLASVDHSAGAGTWDGQPLPKNGNTTRSIAAACFGKKYHDLTSDEAGTLLKTIDRIEAAKRLHVAGRKDLVPHVTPNAKVEQDSPQVAQAAQAESSDDRVDELASKVDSILAALEGLI